LHRSDRRPVPDHTRGGGQSVPAEVLTDRPNPQRRVSPMRSSFLVAAVLWLSAGHHLVAQPASPNQATRASLHSLATPGGGYAPSAAPAGSTPQPRLGATTSAVRALKYFGDQPRDLEASTKFVASCYDEATGGFGDTPGAKPTANTTAVGIMAA